MAYLVRTIYFIIYPLTMYYVEDTSHKIGDTGQRVAFILGEMLDDLPGCLFFSSYSLLILFWAEIYHHARNQSKNSSYFLRPVFVALNIFVYIAEICIWVLFVTLPEERDWVDLAQGLYFSVVYAALCLGFIVYGCNLFFMLRRCPIVSRVRRNKLREVASVTIICTLCFIARLFLQFWGNVTPTVQLHFWFVAGYYTIVEVIPTSMVLFILRKLPPRREELAYSAIINQ